MPVIVSGDTRYGTENSVYPCRRVCRSRKNVARPRSSAAPAPRVTENRGPDSFVARARSRMPMASPRSTWSFGSKSSSGGVPQRRTSTASASESPSGTASSGRLGIVEEDPVELLGEPLLLGLDVPDVLLQLAGALLERGDVAALPGARAHLLRHPLGLGPELVGLADALVAAGEEVLQRRGVERVSAAREPADGVGSRVEKGAGVVHVSSLSGGRFAAGRETGNGSRLAPSPTVESRRRDYEQLVKRSRTCSRVVQGVT